MEQRSFRRKEIFAYAAGRRLPIQMSDQDLLADSDVWKILGRRWTLAILHNIANAETIRFIELKKALIGISGTMLSERLLELENEGLVEKKIYHSMRPKSEYRLTAKAKELLLIMRDVHVWRAGRTSADKGQQLATPLSP